MIIAACIVIFLAILLFSPIKVSALYKGNRLRVMAGLFAPVFVVFDTDKPKKQKKQTEPEKQAESQKTDTQPKKEKPSLDKIKEIFNVIYDALKFLKKHLKFYKFNLNLTFGTGDAAQTAITAGAAWALVYNILGIIDSTFVLKKHSVDIKTVYDGETFDALFETSAGLGLVWGIIMLAVLLKNLKKIR